MTQKERAKQKANELGNMFYQGGIFDHDNEGHRKEKESALRRSRRCVEEVLKELERFDEIPFDRIEFWHGVIIEINNLDK